MTKQALTNDNQLIHFMRKNGGQAVPGIDEVNFFKDDSSIVHFKNPEGNFITPSVRLSAEQCLRNLRKATDKKFIKINQPCRSFSPISYNNLDPNKLTNWKICTPKRETPSRKKRMRTMYQTLLTRISRKLVILIKVSKKIDWLYCINLRQLL